MPFYLSVWNRPPRSRSGSGDCRGVASLHFRGVSLLLRLLVLEVCLDRQYQVCLLVGDSPLVSQVGGLGRILRWHFDQRDLVSTIRDYQHWELSISGYYSC